MSEDEREVEVESDDEEDDYEESQRPHKIEKTSQVLDKRAHHNALERKRRDHIKDSFTGLRDAIPIMAGDKSSRAQILKKASDYISYMRKKTQSHHEDIDDLKRQNMHLEEQIRALEKAKSMGNFASADHVLANAGLKSLPPSGYLSSQQDYEGSGSDTSDGYASSSSVALPTTSTLLTSTTETRRVIAPGQSLLIHKENPPKKKIKIQ